MFEGHTESLRGSRTYTLDAKFNYARLLKNLGELDEAKAVFQTLADCGDEEAREELALLARR